VSVKLWNVGQPMSSDAQVWRLARRLNPEDPVTVARELFDSPEYQGDTSWLKRLLDLADDLSTYQVPTSVSESLIAIRSSGATSSAGHCNGRMRIDS